MIDSLLSYTSGMPVKSRKLRVFVASPGDVSSERDSLATIVNELNSALNALVPDRRAIIELVRWETHAYPAMGRPQALINDQIGSYDIFVGIMWKRFGTNTGIAGSGTEEEFRHAFNAWHTKSVPHIMFYFSNEPVPIPRRSDEIEQLSRVVTFRNEVAVRGLVWEYESATKFPDIVRPHLTSVLGQLLSRATHRAPVARGARKKIKTKKRKVQTLEVRPADRKPIAGLVSIPAGRRLKISAISKADAFYAERHNLVGQTGTSEGIYPHDSEWWTGSVLIDRPLFVGDDRSYGFLKFKLLLLD